MKRLNVLIVAHEFSPEQGSECSEGWNIVTRLAKYHDVNVLYASGSQFHHHSYLDAVNKYINHNEFISGLTFINIDQPTITKLIARFNSNFLKIGSIGLPILYFTGYKFWQKAVYIEAKKLHGIHNFDIVHQLTQITFREPGYLWKLDIPFVWGPTGGTSTIPKGFLSILSWKSKIFEKIRSFSNFYQFNYVQRIIQANKKAALIYAFTKEDAVAFKKRANGKIKLMLDAGTYNHNFENISENDDSSVITGIWCGQLIGRKAPIILLQALALGKFSKQKLKLIIIGSGPLEVSLHRLAKELNIDNIEWISKVSHDEIFELMKTCDFFVHTSYREATSNVIPEALSMGLPVICHDANGMSIAVNENCGIKIPLVSYEESVKGFYQAINSILEDKELLNKIKVGAVLRSKEISWDSMAETIANDYLKIYNENITTK
jgi:glycosyltransferase involved in cell wall biosynthesis